MQNNNDIERVAEVSEQSIHASVGGEGAGVQKQPAQSKKRYWVLWGILAMLVLVAVLLEHCSSSVLNNNPVLNSDMTNNTANLLRKW